MGVKIDPDGSIEEFIVPRHTLKLNVFRPKVVLDGICDIVEGKGPISFLTEMEFQQSNINIFAWEKGSEKTLNRYDYFPPPIDRDVLYGSIFIFRTNRRSGQVQSLTSDLFERYIETCHRGFEDLGSDDSDDDEDDDEDEMPTASDVEFIDNRTLDEIEDDASIQDEDEDEAEDTDDEEEETDEEAEEEAEAEFE